MAARQPRGSGRPRRQAAGGARAAAQRQAGRRTGRSLPGRAAGLRQARRFERQTLERGARHQLRRFRQGTVLAVALTGLLLMIWGVPDVIAQPEGADPQEQVDSAGVAEADAAPGADEPEEDPTGVRTVTELLLGFYTLLPRLVIAIVLIGLALLLANLIHWLLRRSLGAHWERADAFAALVRLLVLLIAIGAGLSVIAGDARALVGSVGLAGLALSWALQTPIESFTGWLMNSFRGYYRVGDRIEVGEVFGDVYRIDVLTTTVWEAGGPGKAVTGAQATGAMITFPNWEVLRSNVINYSRDFPYVWDEVTVAIDNASDMGYTAQTLRRVAQEVFGDRMEQPAEQYRRLLERARLAFDIAEDPQIFLSLDDSWTNFTIRYLVPARERRRWSSELVLAVSAELARPEHKGRIIEGYPVRSLRQGQDA